MNEETTSLNTKCGYVALIGRPNAGKSTLLNKILRQQVAIVTSKAQTTRNRIVAVHNEDDAQYIFLDTPGIHDPQGSLGHYMMEAAEGAIMEADICVWLVDMGNPKRPMALTKAELEIAQRLSNAGRPVIVLLNKIDLIKAKENLLAMMQDLSTMPGIQDIIPISAINNDGVDRFMEVLKGYLPEGDKLYPEDLVSDQAERFFAAEIVREALVDNTWQELPHQSAVVIERFVEETERCVIHATIFVERASQRGIVIGKAGSMLQKIGERSRTAIEDFLGCKVELKLHVNVSPGWTRDAKGLKKMGYE